MNAAEATLVVLAFERVGGESRGEHRIARPEPGE
jgi:hypothetical protein